MQCTNSEQMATRWYRNFSGVLVVLACIGCANEVNNVSSQSQNVTADDTNSFAVTQGRAQKISPVLLECDVPGWRVTALGEITDSEGKTWRTPADVSFVDGPKASDLFNECNDVTLPNAEAMALDGVPITEIDESGEVITVYFFGDNYSEIYVNGKLVGVDPVPYWPFNTAVVRFRAERPFVLGAKLVDWEENLSLGSELMRGVPFHNGDGGFVAVVKGADGNTIDITDEQWRVKTYYMSPLLDPSCVEINDGVRSSENCSWPEKPNAEEGYAVRWPVPDDWADPTFDDSAWTYASLYTNEDIGGSLQRPAYSNFVGLFDNPESDAQFIWSSNLLLDNLVLARKRIE